MFAVISSLLHFLSLSSASGNNTTVVNARVGVGDVLQELTRVEGQFLQNRTGGNVVVQQDAERLVIAFAQGFAYILTQFKTVNEIGQESSNTLSYVTAFCVLLLIIIKGYGMARKRLQKHRHGLRQDVNLNSM